MSTSGKVRTGQEVIAALMSADTPASKSKATRLQKEYIAQRVAEGKDPKKVQAGLISRVNRLQGEQKAAAAPKSTAKVSAATASKTPAATTTGTAKSKSSPATTAAAAATAAKPKAKAAAAKAPKTATKSNAKTAKK